jgi:hypothetical protein
MGGLIFWVLGLPAPIVWGAVMAVLATIPVAGTFVVWAPAAVYLAANGAWGKAAVLVGWGVRRRRARPRPAHALGDGRTPRAAAPSYVSRPCRRFASVTGLPPPDPRGLHQPRPSGQQGLCSYSMTRTLIQRRQGPGITGLAFAEVADPPHDE